MAGMTVDGHALDTDSDAIGEAMTGASDHQRYSRGTNTMPNLFYKYMDIVRQLILQLALFCPVVLATDDFEVTRIGLTERWDWSIAAYRGYLSLPTENSRTAVCNAVFLAIAHGMRLLYGHLAAEQLRALVDAVGPYTFSAVVAIPSIGVVIVSAMQIFDIAGSPLIAISLTLAIAVPIVILPLATFGFRRLPTEHANDSQA